MLGKKAVALQDAPHRPLRRGIEASSVFTWRGSARPFSAASEAAAADPAHPPAAPLIPPLHVVDLMTAEGIVNLTDPRRLSPAPLG
jgi:hypothetical protein